MSHNATETIPTNTPKSSPDQARAAATDFLVDHLGNQLTCGTPHLLVEGARLYWIAPVELGYIHTGILGTVGVIAVDDETTQIVGWTPIPQMKSASQTLNESHEPEISESFKAFMQGHKPA